MGQVKQMATDNAEKAVDNVIDDYIKNNIKFDVAKDKIMKIDNINLVNVDEENVDDVLFYAKEDYWKEKNKIGSSK